ncbi:MAG: class I SAM-dependent methyltransferase [Gemmatimonadales bacterium]
MTGTPDDRWLAGDAYEAYMGRWSRLVAAEFVDWLDVGRDGHWLEVGCGTGALTAAICVGGEPASITACDPSAPFVEHARRLLPDARVRFVVAGLESLPGRSGGFDAVVSGLVMNFLPEPLDAVRALGGLLCGGGVLGAYVWDYAGGMEFLRIFWDEAATLDSGAVELDEGRRFPLCGRGALESLWRAAGLSDVEGRAIEVPTRFADLDAYWTPFLRGTGPAPSYVASLEAARREALREGLRRRLPVGPAGEIELRARAWAVRGVVT